MFDNYLPVKGNVSGGFGGGYLKVGLNGESKLVDEYLLESRPEYFVFSGHRSFDLRLKHKKIRLIFQIFEPKKCKIGEVLSRKRYNAKNAEKRVTDCL